MNKTALLVIDMQNAYFNNGALADEKTNLITKCNELIQSATSTDIPVFAIKTLHSHTQSTWTLNMLDDEQGYLFGDSDDSSFIDGLNIASAIEVSKTRDSAFFGTNLELMLRTIGVEQLVLCGVSTHSCVMLTSADAYAYNFRVVLAKESIASHDLNYHISTMEMLNKEYRQACLSNNEIMQKVMKIK